MSEPPTPALATLVAMSDPHLRANSWPAPEPYFDLLLRRSGKVLDFFLRTSSIMHSVFSQWFVCPKCSLVGLIFILARKQGEGERQREWCRWNETKHVIGCLKVAHISICFFCFLKFLSIWLIYIFPWIAWECSIQSLVRLENAWKWRGG